MEEETVQSQQKICKELAKQWIAMPRIGSDDCCQADQFYEEAVFPVVLQVFCGKHAGKYPHYDGIVLTLGTSWQPLVLSVRALNPDSVVVLYTAETKKYLEQFAFYTEIPMSAIHPTEIEKNDTLAIYTNIKQARKKWGEKAKMAVDITGGTKAMAGGMTIAGAMVGADIVYIGNDNYLREIGKPEPGCEKLEILPDPLAIFGDVEQQRAVVLMEQFDYAGACRIFTQLEAKVPDPRSMELLVLLSKGYEEWDNLDFRSACRNLEKLKQRFYQYRLSDHPIAFAVERIKVQVQLLMRLSESFVSDKTRFLSSDFLCDPRQILPLLFTLYHNALRRERQNKLDMAALLWYRLLEMLEQSRLARYGIDTAAPKYEILSRADLQVAFCSKYTELHEKIYKRKKEIFSLPAQLSLADGYILLAVLGDTLVTTNRIKGIMGLSQVRNMNLFAHGYMLIANDKYRSFKEVSADMLKEYVGLQNESFEWWQKNTEFIQL